MGKKEELYEKQHIIKKKMIILNYFPQQVLRC